jgi:hypothetical protein
MNMMKKALATNIQRFLIMLASSYNVCPHYASLPLQTIDWQHCHAFMGVKAHWDYLDYHNCIFFRLLMNLNCKAIFNINIINFLINVAIDFNGSYI